MSTIFNVVLAVSEAVNGRRSNKDLFDAFVSQLTDMSSWLVKFNTTPSDDEIADILNGIRNGMAHALSTPKDILLVNEIGDAHRAARKHPNIYFVSTTDFVDVVEATVAKLSQAHPSASFDPSGGSDRGPATGRTISI